MASGRTMVTSRSWADAPPAERQTARKAPNFIQLRIIQPPWIAALRQVIGRCRPNGRRDRGPTRESTPSPRARPRSSVEEFDVGELELAGGRDARPGVGPRADAGVGGPVKEHHVGDALPGRQSEGVP